MTPRTLAAWLGYVGLVLSGMTAGDGVAWAEPKPSLNGLSYADAQRFVLGLINQDRKKGGLSPVTLDEAASRAGLRHARDMAANGFTGHVGSDGSVPEQRYTEAGGSDFVQENAACVFDLAERGAADKPRFDARKLRELHGMFMAEVPPNDGHRRNILNPLHNRVGIGLALPRGVSQPCLTQEFVDDYGDYAPLPRDAKGTLRIAGKISAPLSFGGIGFGRTPLPTPPARGQLNGSLYRIPSPDQMYFPKGFKTPKPVALVGRDFSLELDLGKAPKPGKYSFTVWAKKPGSTRLFMVSMRTITLR